MLVQYQKTKRPAMKRIALIALGCTTNHTVLSQYLELAMNETVIRKSDIPIVFTAVLNMRYGLVTVKTFLHRHMKILYEK